MSRLRHLTFQLLDTRLAFDGEDTRSFDSFDVNNDLSVTPLDALIVLKQISESRIRNIRAPSDDPISAARSYGRYDVNNDGIVTPIDALLVINSIRRSDSRAVMRLARDTAPNGTLNDDGITSDLTIEGRLGRNLVSSLKDGVHYFLGRPDSHRFVGTTNFYIELTPYIAGDFFRVPESELTKILPYIGNSIDGAVTLTLFSKTIVNEVTTVESHAKIKVRWDARAPIVTMPFHITDRDQSFSVLVSDHSPLVIPATEDLSFGIADEPSLNYLLIHGSRDVRIDVALTEEMSWTNNQLRLLVNGEIQDVAGNVATLASNITLQRIDSSNLQIPKNQFPGLTAFDADAFVAVPGAVVRLPSPLNGLEQSLRFPVKMPASDSGSSQETTVVVRPWQRGIGEADYAVPENSISGVVTDEFGAVVAKIAVLPKPGNVRIVDGRWSVYTPLSSPHYYRVVGDDNESEVTSPDHDAKWMQLVPGEAVPAFPFGRVQLATAAGFASPQYFAVKIEHADITAIASDSSPGNAGGLWVANRESLVRIHGESGDVIETVDLSLADHSPGVPLLSYAEIATLQNINRDDLPPNIDWFVQAESIESESLLFASINVGGFVIVNPSTAKVVGKLAPIESNTIDTSFKPAVYHPLRKSWISFTHDLLTYRERDVASGILIAEKRVVGSDILLQPGVYNSGFVWDATSSRMVAREYLQPINGIVSFIPWIVFDPSTGRLSSADDSDWDVSGIADSPYGAQFAIDEHGRVVQHVGSGLIQRYDVRQSKSPVLRQIESKSIVGVAANPLAPSANPGQWIELVGENLQDTTIRFDYENESGDLTGTYLYNDVPVRSYTENGDRFWVRVPDEARTGTLQLIGSKQSFMFQIVPGVTNLSTLAQTPTPSLAFTSIDNENTHVIVLQSEASRVDDYRFRVDGIDVTDSVSFLNLPPGYVNLYGLPLPRDTVVVSSDRGSTVLPAPPITLASDPFVATSFSIIHRPFGASVQYERSGVPLPASQVVTAGTTIAIEVAPRSTALEPIEYPSSIAFDLITPVEGGRFRYRSVDGTRIDQGNRYRIELPFEFTGGSVAIRGANRGDAPVPIAIQPTVFAATGDSSKPGGSILLAGVNLSEATFAIGGVPVAATQLSHLTSYDIDLVRVEVPTVTTMTPSLTVIAKDVSANIGTVLPFWADQAMPTAINGTPTYPDLPSINPEQSFSVPDSGLSPETEFESIGTGEREVRLYNRGSGLAAEGSRQISPFAERSGIFMYRVRGTDIGSIIPILANLQAPAIGISEQTESIEAVGIGLEIAGQINIEHRIQWGIESWVVHPRQTHAVSVYDVPRATKEWRVYRATDSLQSPFWFDDAYYYYNRPSNSSESLLWFDTDSVPNLPKEPLQVSTGWGVTTSVAMPTIPVEWSAEFGIPADPSLPSVNAGQSVTLHINDDDFESTGGVAFFKAQYSANYNSTLSPHHGWKGEQISQDSENLGSLTVPDNAIPGGFRVGLFAANQRVQIVPRILPLDELDTPWGPRVRGLGWDSTTKLHVGNVEIELRPDEIANRTVLIQLNDERFSGLSRADFASGIRISTQDGVSNTVFIRMLHDATLADLTPEQQQQFENSLVLRVSGSHLREGEVATIRFAIDTGTFSDVVTLESVSDDGNSALVTVPLRGWVSEKITITRMQLGFGFLAAIDLNLTKILT